VEGKLAENVIWGGGVGWKRQNTVIWERGSKIAQKTVIWYIWTFPCFTSVLFLNSDE